MPKSVDAILGIVNKTDHTVNLNIYSQWDDHPAEDGWSEYQNFTFSRPICIISENGEISNTNIGFNWYGVGSINLNPEEQIQFKTLEVGEVYSIWENLEGSNNLNHIYHLVKKKRSGVIEESVSDIIVQGKDLIDFELWNKQGVTEVVHLIFIEDGLDSTSNVGTGVQYGIIESENYTLPAVGGNGTYLTYLVGSVLLFVSVLVIVFKNKFK